MLSRRSTVLFVVAMATSALVPGCGREPRERLQGKWRGIGIEGLMGEQESKADGWAKGTRLEFTGNKVTVTMPAESPRSGTFRVAQADGEKLKVQFKRPEGGEDLADFKFEKDGTLRWIVGNAQVVMTKAVN